LRPLSDPIRWALRWSTNFGKVNTSDLPTAGPQRDPGEAPAMAFGQPTAFAARINVGGHVDRNQ
jgi:hypothetical protein